MALGLPLAASAVGGLKELIEDKKDGLLFKAGNKDELAEAVIRLLSDKELYDLVSGNAAAKSRKYLINETISKMSSIYDSL
jgi:glycosyltransferase involved in cell wall biosynthesis